MKKLLALGLILVLVMGVLSGCAGGQKDPNKRALLVVSFGTSYTDTREVTIEATEKALAEAYPDYDVRRAFTAQTIIDIMEERDGIEVDNPTEAFEKLKKEGYSEVIVQSLHIMNGAEYDDLVEVAKEYEEAFDKMVMGAPMLTHVEDYHTVVEALKPQIGELKENEAVVFMGHGTHHEANAVYAAMEYVFKDSGMDNVFVGTVEGYPMIDSVLRRLEENEIEKVTLMPFMIVAGDHAENDMGGDEDESWKTVLKKEGYVVDVYMHGLGEAPGIQQLYIDHAKAAMDFDPTADH